MASGQVAADWKEEQAKEDQRTLRIIEIMCYEELHTRLAHNLVGYKLSCLNKLHLEDLLMLKALASFCRL
ncbi:hypothetical protein OSB04_031499 [Centaurea solstitialis]|uniref:Uncharacterized protein n=1 Tax=Centaurea solstitialis TaxID=347529 RepID=A0AA38SLT1_9ASTR|nr:hypothetical protein OSB04_031499 [Centaurea solstitialis]